MQKPNLPINMFENRNVVKVLQATSFTIPEVTTGPSPAGISSGLSPATILDSRRAASGGQIVTSFSDTAGNVVIDVAHPLLPGDVVACAAAGATMAVTVTSPGGKVVTLGPVPCTAVGGVILVWG